MKVLGRYWLLAVLALPLSGGTIREAAPDQKGAPGAPTADPGQVLFDRAQTMLLRRDTTRAMQLFAEAERAGGDYADLSRLHRIRLLGTEKRPAGETRAAALRPLIQSVADPERQQLAWYLAGVSLYESGERENALELLVEAGRLHEGTRWGAASRLLAAEIFLEGDELAPALDLLLRLMEDDAGRNLADGVTYLLARLYARPGVYQSPRRAVHLLERFESDRPPYVRSLWRPRARRLLARLRASY